MPKLAEECDCLFTLLLAVPADGVPFRSITADAHLPMKALEMAVGSRRIKAGLVHHTDRGSQYASHAYRAALEGHGMICSMSRKAQCRDSSAAESFFSRFKDELIYREVWQTKS